MAISPMTTLQSTTATKAPTLDPRYSGLFDQLQGQIGAIPQFNFEDTLNQAFRGPYFQAVSGGLLGALEPRFAQQRLGLQDQFRAAGTKPSSAFAQGMSNLYGQQGLQQNQLLSSLANSLLGTSVQAGQLGLESALAPISAGTNLLRSLPQGESMTTTENVDMNAMINMLMQLKGATGGGGGESMAQFEDRMGVGRGGNPLLDALLGRGTKVNPTGGSNYPSAGYNPGYDWWGDPRGGLPMDTVGGGISGGGPTGYIPGMYNQGSSTNPFFTQDPMSGMSTDPFGYSYSDWINDPYFSSNYGAE